MSDSARTTTVLHLRINLQGNLQTQENWNMPVHLHGLWKGGLGVGHSAHARAMGGHSFGEDAEVAARRGPTFRRRALGKELRRLREKADLTIQDAASGLGFSDTKLGRVETGHNSLPRVEDLEKLLDRYGVDDIDDRDSVLTLHRDSLSRDPYTPYRDTMPSGMPMYVGLESDAREVRTWQPMYVFGLLQTENYARAQFMAAKPVEETTTAFVENNVRLRMERKQLITREDGPLTLRVILDESALRRMIGGPGVMGEQYEEIERLSVLDNVTIQVLPQKLVTFRADINFAVLDFDAPVDPIAQSDIPGTITVTDKPSEVWKYNRRFDAMRDEALGPSATAGFLHQLAREIE
ncbi:helix-turn-helix transcriptional regulator [Streptomyces mirabilis]|uniref:helix-turn-helix domain-containing protein n=1 Tax=Streptomyces mirabilis TaxID=68239 RepID=UPI00333110BD